jgi:hypothetical protein|tara:strand:+ start:511 stop:807 length:297 start_codon:yes stop_codon:yes gene_type:complete
MTYYLFPAEKQFTEEQLGTTKAFLDDMSELENGELYGMPEYSSVNGTIHVFPHQIQIDGRYATGLIKVLANESGATTFRTDRLDTPQDIGELMNIDSE